MKIAIVTTSIRSERVGLDVAKWALNLAKESSFTQAEFEIVDLKEFEVPMFGTSSPEGLANVAKWSQKMAQFDGYIFIVAEYNHSATGVIKNALDYLNKELNNKAVAFVGYGGLGGARAIETLRLVLAELQMASVQRSVNFLLAHDFENYSKFAPAPYHEKNFNTLLEQLILWTGALKNIR